MTPISLADDACLHRYAWNDDNGPVGHVEYYLFGQVAIVTHTGVDAALFGKGRGSELVRRTLNDLHRRNIQVVPICGFFASVIRKNPEYVKYATAESRRIFALDSGPQLPGDLAGQSPFPAAPE